MCNHRHKLTIQERYDIGPKFRVTYGDTQKLVRLHPRYTFDERLRKTAIKVIRKHNKGTHKQVALTTQIQRVEEEFTPKPKRTETGKPVYQDGTSTTLIDPGWLETIDPKTRALVGWTKENSK